MKVINVKEGVTIPFFTGVTGKILISSEKLMFFLVEIGVGHKVPEHSHPHEQMGMVMEGKMKMIIDGKEQIVQPGSAWHIPSDVVHSGECLEDDTVVLEFFSPPREDLVKK